MTEIKRLNSSELDKILGKKFNVLDDGFIRVIDYMGDDSSIVQAARISYGDGTKKINEDRGLIRYLMRHRHTTPFEMCSLKIHVRVPMDVWRQWIRHRTASVNEYSTRYSVAIDSMKKTKPDEWRLQSSINKQGSEPGTFTPASRELTEEESELHDKITSVYRRRIQAGVAREQARKDLPLSTHTEAYWKMDLHNLLHFLSLRIDSHAQQEIRSYANIIGNEIVAKWVPMTWEAFQDYRLESMTFSKPELDCLKALLSGKLDNRNGENLNKEYVVFSKPGSIELTREGKEYQQKLEILK